MMRRRHRPRTGATAARRAMLTPRQRVGVAIAAATALNLPFGTVYAFSGFLKPMEALLSVGRAEMSFVFALATISLTAGMNLAPRLYRSLAPAPLVLTSCVGSAVGLAIMATATGFAQLAQRPPCSRGLQTNRSRCETRNRCG